MTATIGGTIKELGQEHLPKRIPSLPLFFCAGSPCIFQHPLAFPPVPHPLSLCEALLPPQTESSESFPIRQSHSPVSPSFAYLSAVLCLPGVADKWFWVPEGVGGGGGWGCSRRRCGENESDKKKTGNNEQTSTVDARILHICRYFVYTGPPILASCSLLIL